MSFPATCNQIVCLLAQRIPIDAARLVASRVRLEACQRLQRAARQLLKFPLLPRRVIRGFVQIERRPLKARYEYDASTKSAMRFRDDMRTFCQSLPQQYTYSMLACVIHKDGIVMGTPVRVLAKARRCGWLLRDAEESAFHQHPSGGGPQSVELHVWTEVKAVDWQGRWRSHHARACPLC